MEEHGTLPIGVLADGKYHRSYTLVEHGFGHTLAVMHDPAVDAKRLSDEAYYDACLFAKRLSVDGVKELTPELILGLAGQDGHEILNAAGRLEQRRREFRDAAEAAQGEAGSAPKTGNGVGVD